MEKSAMPKCGWSELLPPDKIGGQARGLIQRAVAMAAAHCRSMSQTKWPSMRAHMTVYWRRSSASTPVSALASGIACEQPGATAIPAADKPGILTGMKCLRRFIGGRGRLHYGEALKSPDLRGGWTRTGRGGALREGLGGGAARPAFC